MGKVKLGELVSVINERVDNPAESKYERFVGLEHYDTGSVKIARWGTTELLVSSMKAFCKGDILVARRNVYLKRASCVDFDGITSGDSIVLRVNNTKNQQLIPFVLNTEDFWDYADKYADGTMSKRLSPAIMLDYEFNMPEDNEKAKLSESLWAIERTKDAYKALIEKSDELVKSQFVEMFGDPVDNPMNWPTKALTSMGACKNGMNFHVGDIGVDINCLGVGDFKDYSVIEDTSKLPIVSLNAMPDSDYLLQDGDIVFVRSNGNKALVGRSVAVFPGKNPTTFSGFCIRFRLADTSVQMEYLLQVLKSDSVRKKMQGRGANIQNLNQQILSTLAIPLPPKDLQDQFINFIMQTDKSKLAAKQALESLDAMQKSLMRKHLQSE